MSCQSMGCQVNGFRSSACHVMGQVQARNLPALLPVILLSSALLFGQAPDNSASQPSASPQDAAPSTVELSAPVPAAAPATLPMQKQSTPIPANAPRMSKETRLEIIRDFETQIVYARTSFPMGGKGLILKDGATTPAGQQLQQLLAL